MPTDFDGFPLVVGFELTLACNLRCRHCASSAGRPRPNELSLDEARAICDQFPDLLVREVDFTGGEPLVSSYWQDLASHLHDLGIPVRMVTNGILLESRIPQILDSGLSTVAVSFDGLQATHDFIRGKEGLFRQIAAGVEAALNAGIPMAVITAVNNRNIHELERIYELLQSIGVQHWQVQPIFPRGRAHEEHLNLSESAFVQMGEFIQTVVCASRTKSVNLMPADGVGYFTDLDTRTHPWQGCGAGLSTCGITADGRVKGCLSLPDDFTEGDLRQRDLWDIWFDDNSFRYNRAFTPEQLGSNCRDCAFGEQCRGGCCVMSYANTATFHNDPYCFHRIAHANQEGAATQ